MHILSKVKSFPKPLGLENYYTHNLKGKMKLKKYALFIYALENPK